MSNRSLSYTLESIPTMVEVPFCYVTIGSYTFGLASRKENRSYTQVDFPNFIQNIQVTKINGEVNTYTISLIYGIQAGDDPNIIDHILSEAAGTREILISYGDWSHPQHIFKEEKALMANVQSQVNTKSSQITYTILAVSAALSLMSQSFNFPAVTDKPSNVIMRLLKNDVYGLRKIFPGMRDMSRILSGNLLASDDKIVPIEAMNMCNVWQYMCYLVQCMQPQGSDSIESSPQDAFYAISVSDDTRSVMGGSYFTIKKIGIASWDEKDAYEIDIGYPGNNLVSQFNVRTSEQWTILYQNSKASELKTTYKMNRDGVMVETPSLSVTRDKTQLTTTSKDIAWWKKVTEFPIQASIEIKGLARPSLILQYLKLNVVFYGKRHFYSGRYIITKQVDTISDQGYKTNLDLLRIKGDDPTYMDWYGKDKKAKNLVNVVKQAAQEAATQTKKLLTPWPFNR